MRLPKREISLQLKMDIRTVKKYISLNSDILLKGASQKSHLESVSKKEKI